MGGLSPSQAAAQNAASVAQTSSINASNQSGAGGQYGGGSSPGGSGSGGGGQGNSSPSLGPILDSKGAVITPSSPNPYAPNTPDYRAYAAQQSVISNQNAGKVSDAILAGSIDAANAVYKYTAPAPAPLTADQQAKQDASLQKNIDDFNTRFSGAKVSALKEGPAGSPAYNAFLDNFVSANFKGATDKYVETFGDNPIPSVNSPEGKNYVVNLSEKVGISDNADASKSNALFGLVDPNQQQADKNLVAFEKSLGYSYGPSMTLGQLYAKIGIVKDASGNIIGGPSADTAKFVSYFEQNNPSAKSVMPDYSGYSAQDIKTLEDNTIPTSPAADVLKSLDIYGTGSLPILQAGKSLSYANPTLSPYISPNDVNSAISKSKSNNISLEDALNYTVQNQKDLTTKLQTLGTDIDTKQKQLDSEKGLVIQAPTSPGDLLSHFDAEDQAAYNKIYPSLIQDYNTKVAAKNASISQYQNDLNDLNNQYQGLSTQYSSLSALTPVLENTKNANEKAATSLLSDYTNAQDKAQKQYNEFQNQNAYYNLTENGLIPSAYGEVAPSVSKPVGKTSVVNLTESVGLNDLGNKPSTNPSNSQSKTSTLSPSLLAAEGILLSPDQLSRGSLAEQSALTSAANKAAKIYGTPDNYGGLAEFQNGYVSPVNGGVFTGILPANSSQIGGIETPQSKGKSYSSGVGLQRGSDAEATAIANSITKAQSVYPQQSEYGGLTNEFTTGGPNSVPVQYGGVETPQSAGKSYGYAWDNAQLGTTQLVRGSTAEQNALVSEANKASQYYAPSPDVGLSNVRAIANPNGKGFLYIPAENTKNISDNYGGLAEFQNGYVAPSVGSSSTGILPAGSSPIAGITTPYSNGKTSGIALLSSTSGLPESVDVTKLALPSEDVDKITKNLQYNSGIGINAFDVTYDVNGKSITKEYSGQSSLSDILKDTNSYYVMGGISSYSINPIGSPKSVRVPYSDAQLSGIIGSQQDLVSNLQALKNEGLTSVSLINPDTKQPISDKTYDLGDITRARYNILSDLLATGTPDKSGRVVPTSYELGGYGPQTITRKGLSPAQTQNLFDNRAQEIQNMQDIVDSGAKTFNVIYQSPNTNPTQISPSLTTLTLPVGENAGLTRRSLLLALPTEQINGRDYPVGYSLSYTPEKQTTKALTPGSLGSVIDYGSNALNNMFFKSDQYPLQEIKNADNSVPAQFVKGALGNVENVAKSVGFAGDYLGKTITEGRIPTDTELSGIEPNYASLPVTNALSSVVSSGAGAIVGKPGSADKLYSGLESAGQLAYNNPALFAGEVTSDFLMGEGIGKASSTVTTFLEPTVLGKAFGKIGNVITTKGPSSPYITSGGVKYYGTPSKQTGELSPEDYINNINEAGNISPAKTGRSVLENELKYGGSVTPPEYVSAAPSLLSTDFTTAAKLKGDLGLRQSAIGTPESQITPQDYAKIVNQQENTGSKGNADLYKLQESILKFGAEGRIRAAQNDISNSNFFAKFNANDIPVGVSAPTLPSKAPIETPVLPEETRLIPQPSSQSPIINDNSVDYYFRDNAQGKGTEFLQPETFEGYNPSGEKISYSTTGFDINKLSKIPKSFGAEDITNGIESNNDLFSLNKNYAENPYTGKLYNPKPSKNVLNTGGDLTTLPETFSDTALFEKINSDERNAGYNIKPAFEEPEVVSPEASAKAEKANAEAEKQRESDLYTMFNKSEKVRKAAGLPKGTFIPNAERWKINNIYLGSGLGGFTGDFTGLGSTAARKYRPSGGGGSLLSPSNIYPESGSGSSTIQILKPEEITSQELSVKPEEVFEPVKSTEITESIFETPTKRKRKGPASDLETIYTTLPEGVESPIGRSGIKNIFEPIGIYNGRNRSGLGTINTPKEDFIGRIDSLTEGKGDQIFTPLELFGGKESFIQEPVPVQDQKIGSKQVQGQPEIPYYGYGTDQTYAQISKQITQPDQTYQYPNPQKTIGDFGLPRFNFPFGGGGSGGSNNEDNNGKKLYEIFDVAEEPFGKINVGLGYYELTSAPREEIKKVSKNPLGIDQPMSIGAEGEAYIFNKGRNKYFIL